MSGHYEWLLTGDQPVEVLHEGDEVPGYNEPVTEPLALVFGFGNGAIIEGSRDDLLDMLKRATDMLTEPWPCQH